MHDYEIKKIESGGYRLTICYDSDPGSPREWDNIGTMVCWADRHTFGDKHNFHSPDEFREWWEENGKSGIRLPLYVYEHSGIAMSTDNSRYPFNCPWDSGQVGWIYVTADKLRKEYNSKIITKSIREKAAKYLRGEIEVYSSWLNGEVYGYVLEKVGECEKCGHETKEHIDSCWGYYGEDGTREIERIIKEDADLPKEVRDEFAAEL